jgi:hypothetical protein
MSKIEEKMKKSRLLEKNIIFGIRLCLICVLIALTIYLCIRWGLRDGLIGGFVVFLAFGGFEILFLTFPFGGIKFDFNQKSKGQHSCSDPVDQSAGRSSIRLK